MAVFSIALISVGSPIFRVLGFEYSALNALMLSLTVGFSSASRSLNSTQALLPNLRLGVQLWTIPLILSTLSLVFIENCAYRDGLEFYALVSLPTALLAASFGTAIGMMSRSRKQAIWLFAGFWILTFIISLLPGYIFPQLFTYGWHYGFFPGLVWDEYTELGRGYNWHLLESAALAMVMLLLAHTYTRDRNWWGKIIGLSILYVGLLFSRSDNRVVTSYDKVKEVLTSSMVAGDATLYFQGPSLTLEERHLLQSDIQWYCYDIRKRLGLKDTARLEIFLYPSTESLFQLVGTRNASIAKPWLNELHIAKENLHSLKHELVHVLVREWGSFPFYASWSTALTEGVAMAMEPSYDGMHTLHEHASAILRMELADGVQRVMSFAGFASGASTSSYVLAGSFTKFLLERYPAEKFADAYASINIEAAYGKPLRELEQQWKDVILPLSAHMDVYDSLRTSYYFERSSIVHQPCLRRVGELNHFAGRAFRDHRFHEADSLYGMAYAETGSINSLRGRLSSRMRQLDLEGASLLLHSANYANHPQRLSLYTIKGELEHQRYLDTLLHAELSSGSVLSAYIRKQFAGNGDLIKRYYSSTSSPVDRASVLEPEASQDTNLQRPLQLAQLILTAQSFEEEGSLQKAVDFYKVAYHHALKVDTTQRLPSLIKLQELRLGTASNEMPSVTKPAWTEEMQERRRRRDAELKGYRN